jgi:ATP-dependent 26S proteasome regulatory subunit
MFSKKCRNVYIPEEFKKVIALHIAKNFIKGLVFDVPLLLGIHGKPGTGKTYQCEEVLNEVGAKVFLISGGQLESGTAGEPARLIRETYINASRCVQKKEFELAVILMNDVDTGLGNWGDNVQTTINTQTVYGELMHLTDYPNLVEGYSTIRIPVILTGNDFSKLYKPLIRAGRMTAFEWNPSLHDKQLIVRKIFPELSANDCKRLVETFSEQTIAFFACLRSTCLDDGLWKQISKKGMSKLACVLSQVSTDVGTYDELVNHGKRILQSTQFINHLDDGETRLIM